MPAIYVGLRPEAFEQLRRLAAQERRRPNDQAAVILERELGGTPPCRPAEPAPVRESSEAAR
jgi:hypothetical protein